MQNVKILFTKSFLYVWVFNLKKSNKNKKKRRKKNNLIWCFQVWRNIWITALRKNKNNSEKIILLKSSAGKNKKQQQFSPERSAAGTGR